MKREIITTRPINHNFSRPRYLHFLPIFKILVLRAESSNREARCPDFSKSNIPNRRGSPESRKRPRSIGDVPSFLPNNKDFAKIDDDLSHNIRRCLMNLRSRVSHRWAYIYIYIRMFFPHGSLPRRAETYATLLETRKLPPLRHANGERRRNFRRVSIPNSIGDGRCSWYIIRDSFSRDVTWTLCNFSLPSFPPWRSNLRAQVVRGGQIRIFCAIPYHYILLPTHGVINNQDFIEFRTI